MSTDLKGILVERNRTYGDYRDNAKIMQQIKDLFRGHPGWSRLNAMHREALDCFALKIGRILVGDPDHRDNWDDIAGYARCVSERIPMTVPATDSNKHAKQVLCLVSERRAVDFGGNTIEDCRYPDCDCERTDA